MRWKRADASREPVGGTDGFNGGLKPPRRRHWKRVVLTVFLILLSLLLLLASGTAVLLSQPSFGRLPTGRRLERVLASPNYVDGEFRYVIPTGVMAHRKNGFGAMWKFLTQKYPDTRPERPVAAVKTDLRGLDRADDLIVWFGHSSYLLQVEGRRLLVDPVFYAAAPVGWVNRPFPGTDLWKPADLPECDWLVITHDHWDHLDCQTVKELQGSLKAVLTPLGVGEHFEYWGYPETMLHELDWGEKLDLGDGFALYCLPARHFSGRSWRRNQTLWASFLLKTPSGRQIYLGGDGGWGPHFQYIGKTFPGIDLAILENGQYNADWAQIHTLPSELPQICRELGAAEIITVHHSKYTLSRHPWDEPRRNEESLAAAGFPVRPLVMGQPEKLWIAPASAVDR